MVNFHTVAPHQQIPLLHVVNEDDELLANSPEAEWYKILQNLPWEQYRSIGADYYNALYHFNKLSATQRLLFNRVTMDEAASVLLDENFITEIDSIVSPSMIAPGKTPDRLGGKKPKCFFALFLFFFLLLWEG